MFVLLFLVENLGDFSVLSSSTSVFSPSPLPEQHLINNVQIFREYVSKLKRLFRLP